VKEEELSKNNHLQESKNEDIDDDASISDSDDGCNRNNYKDSNDFICDYRN
jgi:hypothetical protein